MSYSKKEQEKWEEFEQACLATGIDAKSFCETDELFEDFDKFKKWRKVKNENKIR